MGAALSLAASVAVPLGVGMVGGMVTKDAVQGWYKTLRKPAWTPPNWLFPVAWTWLYASMGYASWLVGTRVGFVAAPLKWYAAQLGLNVAWSPLFFGKKDLGLALVDIAGLWATVVATCVKFWEVSPTAGALFLPYIAWVSYAGCLNAWIWNHNPKQKPEEKSA